jgi:hypothetical protein
MATIGALCSTKSSFETAITRSVSRYIHVHIYQKQKGLTRRVQNRNSSITMTSNHLGKLVNVNTISNILDLRTTGCLTAMLLIKYTVSAFCLIYNEHAKSRKYL